jgi:hypothetical protein
MKKNVAGQSIGAQMITAADGSAFTGSVTVYVTGDAGTQAAGSVGSGACTHEGNGYHTYAPSQGETNYDLIAFTFTGTGAIPVTVQVFTAFPQTGDSYARLGAPAGASVSADIASVKSDSAAILVDTGTTLDGKIDSILEDTGTSIPAQITALSIPTTAQIKTALEAAGSHLALILEDTGTTLDGKIDSILEDTGTSIPAQITALSIPTTAQIKTALEAAGSHLALILEDTGTTLPGSLTTLAGYIDTEVASILGAVDTEIASIISTLGVAGAGLTGIPWNSAWDDEVQSEVADALATYDPPTNAEMEARTLSAASYATSENLDTVGVVVDAIKLKTDALPASPAATGDIPSAEAVADAVWDEAQAGHTGAGTFGLYLDDKVSEAGGGSLTAADIADAVWDEDLSGHLDSGSTGAGLNAAGSAGDPWATALPGAYGAGTAGYVLAGIKNKTDTLGGAGAVSWTYTLTRSDTGAPIDGAEVWVTTDEAGNNVVASGITNTSGVVTFTLDAGIVYVWRKKAGFNFDNPDEEEVS